ncbi:MAG: O-acyltransferase [Planctomycetota bacterium]|nr:MAG: O-acyltransferase [Planctomycetota bacterium]
MLFNTLEFAVFMALVLVLYLALKHRAQNRMLLVASYVFYGAWDWRFLGLIALSTVIDYFVALRMHASDDDKQRKRFMLLSLVSNLGILGLFKYHDFFATSLANLGRDIGWTFEPWLLEIALPVGISFYTFQTLSYTIDVYRRELEPTRNFLDFALFVAFFPQLVAGPIERASRLLPQILKPRTPNWESFGSGCWLILSGTFKKVVVADNLALMVDLVYGDPEAATSAQILLGTYAFAWQIYCDFSGYTDVARGVSRLLGFELMLNFRLPYLATNPSDFWRRWHISLSTWLRDYLYISLGGNRGAPWKTYRNLALTMLLGGLWHGAGWTFVIWGAYQGALLIVHRLLEPTLARLAPSGAWGQRLWWLLRVFVMFQLACVGWMIFRADNLSHLGALLDGLFSAFDWASITPWRRAFAVLVGPLAIFQLIQAARRDQETILRWPVPVRALVYTLIFFGIVLLGEDHGGAFIYFQF